MKKVLFGLLCCAALASGCGNSDRVNEFLATNNVTFNLGGGFGPIGGNCSGTAATVIAVDVTGNAAQGYAFAYADLNGTNADTDPVDGSLGGDVTSTASGTPGQVLTIFSNVNVPNVAVVTITVNGSPGNGIAQGDVINVIGAAGPPPGATKFAIVNLAQAIGGQASWLSSGGQLEITQLTPPTGGTPGTVTLTLRGVCFQANQGSSAQGTFTLNGQARSPLGNGGGSTL